MQIRMTTGRLPVGGRSTTKSEVMISLVRIFFFFDAVGGIAYCSHHVVMNYGCDILARWYEIDVKNVSTFHARLRGSRNPLLTDK